MIAPEDMDGFVNRGEEISIISKALGSAEDKKGGMIMLSGEAGIGKSRLVEETVKWAVGAGFEALQGRCQEYNRSPYMPFIDMLRGFFGIEDGATYLQNVEHFFGIVGSRYPSLTHYKEELLEFFYPPDEPLGAIRLEEGKWSKCLSMLRDRGYQTVLIVDEDDDPNLLEAPEVISLGTSKSTDLDPERLDKLVKTMEDRYTRTRHMAFLFPSLSTLLEHNTRPKVDRFIRIVDSTARANNGIAIFPDLGMYDDLTGWMDRCSSELYIDIKENNGKKRVDEETLLSIFDIILTLFRVISEKRPLLLVIEDLHWGDKATFNLLQHIARKAREESILIIGTYRTEEAGGTGSESTTLLMEALQRASREHLFSTLTLDRFDMESTGELVGMLVGTEPKDDVVKYIFRETEGNPLFIIEMVNTLQGGVRKIEGAKGVSARALVESRLSQLDERTREVLEQVSVLGDGLTLNAIAGTLSDDPEEVLDILDSLINMKFLKEEGDQFNFEHPKVKETIYELMDSERKMMMHKRAAEVLISSSSSDASLGPEKLAYHYRGAGDHPTAYRYMLEAAENKIARFAYDDALVNLKGCLESLNELEPTREVNVDKIKVLCKIGDVEEETGDYEGAIESFKLALTIAERKGLKDHLVPSYRRLGDLKLKKFVWGEAAEMYLTAIRMAEKNQDEFELSRSFRGLGRMYLLKGDYQRALECFIKYFEMPDDLRSKQYVTALQEMGDVHLEKGDLDKALYRYKMSVKAVGGSDRSRELIDGYLRMARVLILLGEVEDARRFADDSLWISRTLQNMNLHIRVVVEYSELMLDAGERDAAEKVLRQLEPHEVVRGPDRLVHSKYRRAMGRIYALKRDLQMSDESFRISLEIQSELGIPYQLGMTHLMYGLIRFNRMDVEGAAEELGKARDIFKSTNSLYYLNRATSKCREVTFILKGMG